MKKETFTRNDKTEGFNLILEDKDEFVPTYSKPRLNNKGKYPNYSIAFKVEGRDEPDYLKLTTGQAKQIEKLGDVTGKTLVAYKYIHPTYNKEFIGIKLKQ